MDSVLKGSLFLILYCRINIFYASFEVAIMITVLT